MKIKTKPIYIMEHHEEPYRFINGVYQSLGDALRDCRLMSEDMKRLKVISEWNPDKIGFPLPKKVYDCWGNEWQGRYYLQISVNGFLHNPTTLKDEATVA